jgi:hypothetical protein
MLEYIKIMYDLRWNTINIINDNKKNIQIFYRIIYLFILLLLILRWYYNI